MNDYEPTEMVADNPTEWRKTLDAYKASGGWELTYYFRGANANFDATGTVDGDSWIVSVTPFYAPQGQEYAEGKAVWQAWVKKGEEQHLVGRGEVTLLPSLRFGANYSYDGRTQLERDLAAVRAALVPATSVGVQEYEINGVGSGRRLRNYSREDLIRLETNLAQRVNAERRREARAKGGSYFKTIYPR